MWALRTTGMSDRGQHRGSRKHLLQTEQVGRLAEVARDVDLTRAHGQGNGMRVHLLYFGLVSIAVFAFFIVAILMAGMV